MGKINEQLDEQHILDDNQFGFRKNHSTLHPLLIVKNFIETELNLGKNLVILSLDLSKAFDIVNTSTKLQKKIKYYTKSDKITNWIDSFYSERSQFVSWKNISSNIEKNHRISIIQGSSLGPNMYNIYTNDLPKICNKNLIVSFADDSTELFSHKNPIELNYLVNEKLAKVKDYFEANGLSINTDKTTFLHFVPKNQKRIKLEIKFGNKILKESEEILFLGVTLDNKLSFNSHFKKTYDKMKKGLNGLTIARNILDYRSKMNIYHSLIHSHLSYCALIWIPNISKKQTKMLQTLQKRAIRNIFNLKYNSHTSKYFQISKITKIENIFEKESLLLAYKYKEKKLPNAIMNLFENSQHEPNILTRSQNNSILRPKRELKPGFLMYDILNFWNKASKSLREEPTYKIFKRKITENHNVYIECMKNECYACKKTQK